jgi:hypothetical protein
MRLFEIYSKDIALKEFWSILEKDLVINEADSGLGGLIQQANELIFNKFGINPSDRVYYIAGSARLYLYPTLREAFNLTSEIGDLDIVIPDKQHWINAGLEDQWNAGGIYRPEGNNEIEAFNTWDP